MWDTGSGSIQYELYPRSLFFIGIDIQADVHADSNIWFVLGIIAHRYTIAIVESLVEVLCIPPLLTELLAVSRLLDPALTGVLVALDARLDQ